MIQLISCSKTYELPVKTFSLPLAIKIHQGAEAAILVSILMTTFEAFQNISSIIAYLFLFPFLSLNIQKDISSPMFATSILQSPKYGSSPHIHQ